MFVLPKLVISLGEKALEPNHLTLIFLLPEKCYNHLFP